jgi:hypothetical protein
MLFPVLLANDVLACVCSHLRCVRELAKLSAVCTRTRALLRVSDCWERVAHEVYGCEMGHRGRAGTALAVCPWVNEPAAFHPELRILKWSVLDGDSVYARCELGGLLLDARAKRAGKVLRAFREMDDFYSIKIEWSECFEAVYEKLLEEGYISWSMADSDVEKADVIHMLPIHKRTLVVSVMDPQNPVLHFFHVDSAGSSQKTLRLVRTVRVPDMCLRVGIVVCEQNIWVPLRSGGFQIWGPAAAHCRRRVPLPYEKLYRPFCLLKDDRVNKGMEVLAAESTQLRSHCNTQDADGETLLHAAVRTNCEDVVELLLRVNSDPNVCNYSEGLTPLTLALTSTSTKTSIGRLLHYCGGRDVAALDGRTALQKCVAMQSSVALRNYELVMGRVSHADASPKARRLLG